MLQIPELFDGAEEHYANIWRWHAFEETEHKAVAYDVWNTAMGQGIYAYLLRSFGLVAATIVFWGFVLPVFTKIVIDEKKID